jgi:hypothetical protein
MKQIAMIRRRFDYRFSVLACDENLYENFHSWWSRFEGLLIDAFWEVFAEGKKSLERDPARFAHETLTSWSLGADGASRVLFEVENHYDWRDLLRDLEHATRSEIFPEDFGYRPVPKSCLATVSQSPALRRTLSQMHPHLTKAVGSVIAGEACATVEEVVDRFPVLNGIADSELTRLRGARDIAVVAAAKELLCNRLRTRISERTIERYFRPKEFLPR